MGNKPGQLRVALVMPVYNEAGSVEGFLREIVGASGERKISIVVVDDCSTDKTPEVLSALRHDGIPLTLIRNDSNLGHGPSTVRALQKGLELGVDIVVATDGDGQISCHDLFSMADVAFERHCLVEGCRTNRQDEWFRKLVSLGTRILVAMRSGAFPRDANTPFRAYPFVFLAEVLREIPESSMTPNLLISSLVRVRKLPFCEIEVLPFLRAGTDSRGVTWKQNFTYIPSQRFLKFIWNALSDWRKSTARSAAPTPEAQSFTESIIGRASVGRYAVIGITGVLVDFLIFATLVAAGIQPVGATLLSTFAGILNNYLLNSSLNFRMPLSRFRGFRYFLVGICGLSASALLIYLLSAVGLAPIFAKLISVPLVVGGQFLANKYWTFFESQTN